MSELRCSVCDKAFAKANSLSKHKSRSHPEKPPEKFGCFYCEYKTVYKFNLNKHMNKVHLDEAGAVIEKRVSSQPLKVCSLCNTFECIDRSKMINHYLDVHDVTINEEILFFNNFEDFVLWKRETESQECCRFVAASSQRKRRTKHVWFFRCFRDGHYMPRGTGKRSLKVKGSVKIGSVCPCSMKVTKTLETGAVSVLYITPHVGHKPDVSRLTLTKEERDYIAGKMSAGVPDDELLTSLRDSMSYAELSRLHLTTRKDLWNIKNAARIQEKSEADEQSVVCERAKYEDMKRALIDHFSSLIDSTTNCVQLELIRKAFLPLPDAIKALETKPSSTISCGKFNFPTELSTKNVKSCKQNMKTSENTSQPTISIQEEDLTGCVLSEIVNQPLYAQDVHDTNGENAFQVLY